MHVTYGNAKGAGQVLLDTGPGSGEEGGPDGAMLGHADVMQAEGIIIVGQRQVDGAFDQAPLAV